MTLTQPCLEICIPFHPHLTGGEVDGQHAVPGIGQQAFAIIQAASARLDDHYIIGAGFQKMIDFPEQLPKGVDDLQTFSWYQ